MSRFLKDTDYDTLIKTEILTLLKGATPTNLGESYKLLTAEKWAISQIRKWLSGRVDCDTIFSTSNDPDERDGFMVMLTIDITLYHLYSQTPSKDVPEHRSSRYEDALSFLKDAGRGAIPTDLPSNLSDSNQGEVRIWSTPIDSDDW
jgi:hypothetical protein